MRQGSVENPTIRLSDFWSKCSSETLRMQQEAKPGMDIIPDLDLGEDEQMQSHSLGDTEILEEQFHIEKDMKATLQSQQHEEREGKGSVT